ncbi:MAG: PduL/EutD family phosphate acyltransferase [bacterium]|nr:PduL/EutD family phosphate acyltransferase [bacterium]
MQVKIGVSNRHVHLTKEDFYKLFGKENITIKNKLTQQSEFSSNSVVTIKTDKSTLDNVRVLGPFREYTQVEISKTDSYKLGINPPVRDSGDLIDSEKVTIIGPNGQISKKCCIIATRHIHINHWDRVRYDFLNEKNIKVRIGNEKSIILENVKVKETDNGILELHIDTDDANASLVKTGDMAEIITN